jgi:hypothetical protein
MYKNKNIKEKSDRLLLSQDTAKRLLGPATAAAMDLNLDRTANCELTALA